MSLFGDVAAVLAWPYNSGVAGGAIAGVAAYVHTHVLMRRRHQRALSQAERHHAERQAQATAHHSERLHQAEKHHQQAWDAAAAKLPRRRT